MTCVICGVRRPKRACPGVRGDICAICCGQEREVTVSCPFECEYLQEARRHEKALPLDESAIPDADIKVTERQLDDNTELLNAMASSVAASALSTGALDSDVREALAALARTYRTLQSGVYYETRPAGSFASAIYDAAMDAARAFREAEQKDGITRTRDADVLVVVVFLERAALGWNNGRVRGRSFIDWLRRYYGDPTAAGSDEGRSSLFLA